MKQVGRLGFLLLLSLIVLRRIRGPNESEHRQSDLSAAAGGCRRTAGVPIHRDRWPSPLHVVCRYRGLAGRDRARARDGRASRHRHSSRGHGVRGDRHRCPRRERQRGIPACRRQAELDDRGLPPPGERAPHVQSENARARREARRDSWSPAMPHPATGTSSAPSLKWTPLARRSGAPVRIEHGQHRRRRRHRRRGERLHADRAQRHRTHRCRHAAEIRRRGLAALVLRSAGCGPEAICREARGGRVGPAYVLRTWSPERHHRQDHRDRRRGAEDVDQSSGRNSTRNRCGSIPRATSNRRHASSPKRGVGHDPEALPRGSGALGACVRTVVGAGAAVDAGRGYRLRSLGGSYLYVTVDSGRAAGSVALIKLDAPARCSGSSPRLPPRGP